MAAWTKRMSCPNPPSLSEVEEELSDLYELVEEYPREEPFVINGQPMADEAILGSLRKWIGILQTEAKAKKAYEEAVAARREIILEARCFARDLGHAIDESLREDARAWDEEDDREWRAVPAGNLPWGN